MKRLALAVALALTAGILSAVPTAHADTPTAVTVDGASPGRTYDGIGALSAGASSRLLVDYPEPARGQLLDYLFKPGYGAALQILKVEIGGDTNSTDGTEPSHARTATDLSCDRGYEWWLMEEAKKRNPDILLNALAWGAPGWVGNGRQTVWTDQFIDYLLSWLGCADRHGLRIDYLGGWNEKGAEPAWYVKLKAALAAHGYGYVKIVADDSFNWTVVGQMQADPAFTRAVDVVGQHYVCGYLSAYTDCPSPDAAKALGKPLWASEQGSQPYDTGAAPLARSYNRQYVDGRMTGTVNWSLEWSAYQGLPFPGDGLLLANEPWSGHYIIGPSVWATAQTTQVTRPGWRYLDTGSQRIPGGSVVSLRDPAGTNWSSIAETLDATAPQQVSYAVTGGLSTGPVRVWATDLNSADPKDWYVRQPDITPHGGAFTATLKPGYVYSFTTTGGQGHGGATSPKAAAWSLPYHDTFDGYAPDSTPRYLSDLGGTFATAPCAGGRSGQCLRQVVSQQPVQWNHTDNFPLTIVGDPDHWTNYQAGVDALLEQGGAVELGGRTVNGVSGYHLRITSAGGWTLNKVTPDGKGTVLASGTAGIGVGQWHRLGLTLRDLEVTATLDGSPLATVSDQTYLAGQVSLAVTPWQNAQFDNLVVTPAPSRASHLTATDPGPVTVPAGASATASTTIANPGPAPATGVTATLAAPAGWTVTPSGTGPTGLAVGQHGAWGWTVTPPAGAAVGVYPATLTVRYQSGGQTGTLTRDVRLLLGVIPHPGMTASADSYQGGYEPAKAIDDDPVTMWHSAWSPYQPLPHALTLDLGRSGTVDGLLYQPRNDGNHNGIITSYTVAVSADGTSWQQVAAGQWAEDATLKTLRFAPVAARYVRLTALAAGGGYASAAEVNILGRLS